MTNQIPEEKLNKADGGFSLVEVIVSIVILALVTIPLLNYFTDSMRHSMQMAQQQRATLAAQKVTESLKAVNRLIEETGPSAYGVPYLSILLDDCILAEGGFDQYGTGTAIYTGTLSQNSENFDVRVKISTSTSANAVERPLIYGIDDAKDVLILERDQKEEALTYFTSVNVSAGETVLSQDQITAKMTRTIHILVDFIQEGDTNPKNEYYTVKAYYEYKCEGLRGDGADGTASNDTYTGTYLVNSKVAGLENIYLLFDCIAEEESIDLEVSSDAKTNITYGSSWLGLYLIAQKNDPPITKTLTLEGPEKRTWVSVHTNVAKVVDALGEVTKESLEATGSPTRLIEIKTEVYRKNHEATDDSLIVVETTKGE